jgi:hypothetical protein
MSKIEVDTIAPQSGTTVTLGESGDTVNIPSGVTLTNSGTATGFGISWQSDIKTSAFTAVAGEGYWINTTSAAITITLPASASVGDEIEFTDYARTWNTNNLTINQNSLNYQGYSSPNPVYNVNGQHVRIVYSGATQGWIPTVDDDVTLETPQTYSSTVLVVAGGGSSGSATSSPKYSAGGGGGGGYRTSTPNLTPGSTYTVTVGGGGVCNPSGWGTNGSDSSISGTGVSITSAGGGCGGDGVGTGQAAVVQAGQDGGSGGGGGSIVAYQSGGTGNTPSTSPSQGNNGGTGNNDGLTAGGGGGGAGAVGANGDGDVAGGDGGNGSQSSITGTATYYAGGGGGGFGYAGGTGTAGSGGLGGGGNGGGSGIGDNGTANTGGGAGGSHGDPGSIGASGGSGVVIIRVATADYSGTTTGSPTVTTDGTDTVIKFTGDGSYTA